MKQYTISIKQYTDFVNDLQSLEGYLEISKVTQHIIVGKEDRIEIKLKDGTKAAIRGYYNRDRNVRVEIDEKGETISQMLERYIKSEAI